MCQVLMLMGHETTAGCHKMGSAADCNRLRHHQGVFGLDLLYIDLLIGPSVHRSIMHMQDPFHQLTCNDLWTMGPLIPPFLRQR